jgi:ABC-type Zn uptake system ZnuABC Zn-binding protein ZnuA
VSGATAARGLLFGARRREMVLLYASSLLVPLAAAGQPRYAATGPPVAAILREIVAGRTEVATIVPPGASPHTFEPRPSDLRAVETAAALFSVSRQFDGWAVRMPAAQTFETFAWVPQGSRLSAYANAGSDHDHGPYDPHFWTDPLVVKEVLPHAQRVLCGLDPPGCPAYEANTRRFGAELDALHREVAATLAPVRGRPVLLFHPSLLYLLKRHGLVLVGVVEPFPGKEPTPKYLASLLETIRKAGVKAVFTEPQLPSRPAQVVAEASHTRLYVLDPYGGVEGRTRYADVVRYNARVLAEALR